MSESSHNALKQLPTDRRALLAGIGGLAAGSFLAAGRAEAGPLNPPAAPASTPGPEPRIPINAQNTPGDAETEFRITQSGSYYLTGNVTVGNGKHGIHIQANNVHLDMMGYTIRGLAGSLDGVFTSSSQRPEAVTIRNGIFDNMRSGISLLGRGHHVEYVTVINSGVGRPVGADIGRGMYVTDDSTIIHCQAINNTVWGFGVERGSVIHNCIASGNNSGFAVNSESYVSGCISRLNTGYGFSLGNSAAINNCVAIDNGRTGFQLGSITSIRDCTARFNGEGGITGGGNVAGCQAVQNTGVGISGYVVTDCTVSGNSGDGISGSIVSNCRSQSNTQRGINATASVSGCQSSTNGGIGIRIASGGEVHDCMSRGNTGVGIDAGEACEMTGNTVSNGSTHGISGGNDCTIRENTVSSNGGRGINGGSRCIIEGNNVARNSALGILAISDSTIRNNTCNNNRNTQGVGSGIRVTGAGNRIEGNHLVLNSPGLDIAGGSNLIFGNSTRANTPNYDIAGGNTVGPLVTGANIGSSNNPHSNYEF